MSSSSFSARPSLSERVLITPGRTPTSNSNTKIFSSYIQDLNVYKEMCAQYKAAKSISDQNQETQRFKKNDVSKKLFPEASEEGMEESGKIIGELRQYQLEYEALKIELGSVELERDEKSKQLTQVLEQFQEILSDNQTLKRHVEILQEEIKEVNRQRNTQKTPERKKCSFCQSYGQLKSAYDELKEQLQTFKDDIEREKRDRQYWELKYSEISMEYDNLVKNQQIYNKQSTENPKHIQNSTHQRSTTISLNKPPAFPSSKSLSSSYAGQVSDNEGCSEISQNDLKNELILQNAYRQQMLRELKNLSVQTISSGYNQQLSFGSKEWTKIKAQQTNEYSSSWEINPPGKNVSQTERSFNNSRLDQIGSSQISSNCHQDSAISQGYSRQDQSHIQQNLNQVNRSGNSSFYEDDNCRKSNKSNNINSNNHYNNTPQSNVSYKYLPLETSSETASPQKIFQNSRTQPPNHHHSRIHSQQMTPMKTNSLTNSQNHSKFTRALSACGKILPGYTAEINLSSSNEKIEVNQKKSDLLDEFKCQQQYENNVSNHTSQVGGIHGKSDHRDADSAGTICRYNSSSRECSEMIDEQNNKQYFEESTRSGKFQEKIPLCGSSNRSSRQYGE